MCLDAHRTLRSGSDRGFDGRRTPRSPGQPTCAIIRQPYSRAPSVGAWRSLVARIVRDDEVGGSNPLAPTIPNRYLKVPWHDRCQAEFDRRLGEIERRLPQAERIDPIEEGFWPQAVREQVSNVLVVAGTGESAACQLCQEVYGFAWGLGCALSTGILVGQRARLSSARGLSFAGSLAL